MSEYQMVGFARARDRRLLKNDSPLAIMDPLGVDLRINGWKESTRSHEPTCLLPVWLY